MTAAAPRRAFPRPIADLVSGCLGKALAAQGFAGAEIMTRWAEIAGPELAARSQPLKISWPRRGPDGAAEPATLVVRVEGAFVLELQQQAPILVERINRYLGWGGVGRIRIRQGPVARAAPRRRVAPAIVAAVEERLDRQLGGVAEPQLAAALRRLGRGVLAKG